MLKNVLFHVKILRSQILQQSLAYLADQIATLALILVIFLVLVANQDIFFMQIQVVIRIAYPINFFIQLHLHVKIVIQIVKLVMVNIKQIVLHANPPISFILLNAFFHVLEE